MPQNETHARAHAKVTINLARTLTEQYASRATITETTIDLEIPLREAELDKSSPEFRRLLEDAIDQANERIRDQFDRQVRLVKEDRRREAEADELGG